MSLERKLGQRLPRRDLLRLMGGAAAFFAVRSLLGVPEVRAQSEEIEVLPGGGSWDPRDFAQFRGPNGTLPEDVIANIKEQLPDRQVRILWGFDPEAVDWSSSVPGLPANVNQLREVNDGQTLFVVTEPESQEPVVCDDVERNLGLDRELALGVAEEINRVRTEAGLSELEVNAELTRAAEDFATFLVVENGGEIEHGADGISDIERAHRAGYPWFANENLAGWLGDYCGPGFEAAHLAIRVSPQIPVDMWLDSPPHRAAMFDERLQDVGVGCYKQIRVLGSSSTTVVTSVAMFGVRVEL